MQLIPNLFIHVILLSNIAIVHFRKILAKEFSNFTFDSDTRSLISAVKSTSIGRLRKQSQLTIIHIYRDMQRNNKMHDITFTLLPV